MTRVLCINEHSLYRGSKGTVLSWHVLREGERGGDYDWTAAYAIVAWDNRSPITLVGVSDLTVLVQP